MAEGSPSPRRRITGIGLAVLLFGGALYLASRTSPPPVSPEAQAPSAPALAGSEEPAETAAAPGPAAPGAAVEPPAAEGANPEPAAGGPGIDLVRVEPDGSAVVAGTAEPGSKVTILADASPVAEVDADASGNFVALFKVAPSMAPRALTIEAAPPGGGPAAGSADVVMLLPRAPEPASAETAPAPPAAPAGPAGPGPAPSATAATDIATAPSATAATDIATAPPPPPAPGAPVAEVAATAIVRGDTVEVMPTDGATKGLALASISYSQAGKVTLAGLARAGSVLRAYVDNRFAEEAQAGRDGRWSMDLGGVAGGLYKLRIDELGADGKVADRVETPFQRDYPKAPPPRPGAPAGAGTVTVQPGNSLWTLARTRYGSGTMYTQIFTANREQISDPNLIYPGQILSVPENVPEQQAVE